MLTFPLKEFFTDLFGNDIYLVGGTVRDHLLQRHIAETRDIDLLVTNCTYQDIERKLSPHGKTNTVGKSFAVIKFTRDGHTFDIAVPRKDSRLNDRSHGHRDFAIEQGPHIPLEEDLKRRDFTCNSIAWRLADDAIIDPFAGVRAIRERRLIMTSRDTFSDDPLRILRAARFAAVLRFAVDEAIYLHVKDVSLQELSVERIMDELFRLLLESEEPSRGLTEFFRLAILEKLFPELFALTLTIQDSFFHPERDEYGHHTVWAHTLICADIARKLGRQYALDDERCLALLLGALLHDIGKAATTHWEFKRSRMTVTSIGHDTQGVKISENLLNRLRIETRNHYPLKKVILNLVKYHHRIFALYRDQETISYKTIARTFKEMENEDLLLILLDFADRRSRETVPLEFAALDEISQWFLRKKEEFQINRETIRPLIMGRDLLSLGLSPGVEMGKQLKKIYELQLDGAFKTKEEGMAIIKEWLAAESR